MTWPRIRGQRPKTREVCGWCLRKRLPKFLGWRPGVEAWMCSDEADCDRAVDRAVKRKRIRL